MVIETTKGYFEILKNVREAFNKQVFEDYYIEELYDKYEFIVLDIADEKPRIKGFSKDPNSKDYFHYIMDYVIESCNFLAPYCVLRRINEKEYLDHKDDKANDSITKPFSEVKSIEKENFDKDALVLDHTDRNEKNIDISSEKYSTVSLYPLPEDVKAEIAKERLNDLKNKGRNNNNKKRFSNNNKQAQPKVFSHRNS